MSPPGRLRATYQPDGSAVDAPLVEVIALAGLSPPGVRAARVSLTDSMVCCGPRIRRTFKYPSTANAAAVNTMTANTIRNATHRHSHVSRSSAAKKKKKNVE